jgi:hypothetical protein
MNITKVTVKNKNLPTNVLKEPALTAVSTMLAMERLDCVD